MECKIVSVQRARFMSHDTFFFVIAEIDGVKYFFFISREIVQDTFGFYFEFCHPVPIDCLATLSNSIVAWFKTRHM